MDETMTVNKIINQLDQQLDLMTQYQRNRKKKLVKFHKQFKTEEKNLRTELGNQTNQSSRRKLKKKLRIVKKAYSMIDS